MLPGQSGVALAKKIRADERTRELPIIMLTARVHEEDKVQGLEAGADDYVTKPFSPKELVARVRAVLRRRAPHLAGEAVEIGDLALNPATHRVLAGGQPIELGPTEFRLLFFFMTHAERVYTRAQLLDEVWGDHVFIEERTVDVHIRRLRAALERPAITSGSKPCAAPATASGEPEPRDRIFADPCAVAGDAGGGRRLAGRHFVAPWAGWTVFCGGLGLQMAFHFRNFARLDRWSHAPVVDPAWKARAPGMAFSAASTATKRTCARRSSPRDQEITMLIAAGRR
jgi:hypothetical protein